MKIRSIFLTVLLVVSAPLHAAIFDAFLNLDGIPGESQDQQFPNQIEIDSWQWGITGAPAASAGQITGRATFQDFNITKHLDKSSPVLMLGCASGKHYNQAVISLRKTGDNPVVYLTITMSDVLISSYSVAGSKESSTAPTEQISFAYGKIEYKYTPQNADGKPGEPVFFSWDLLAIRAL